MAVQDLVVTDHEARKLLRLRNYAELEQLVEDGHLLRHPHIANAFAREEIERFVRLGVQSTREAAAEHTAPAIGQFRQTANLPR